MTSKDLRGSYYIIYFGFAKCPDVCPNFLIRVSNAMRILRKMPDSRYLRLKVLFVSLDPDRDTPDKLRKFLNFFDPAIIGLSGTSNNDFILKDCTNKFKVYSNKIPMGDQKANNDNYMIDHTSLGFLMDD
jgi:protein SCO1/2